jgi:hypothetical protein
MRRLVMGRLMIAGMGKAETSPGVGGATPAAPPVAPAPPHDGAPPARPRKQFKLPTLEMAQAVL